VAEVHIESVQVTEGATSELPGCREHPWRVLESVPGGAECSHDFVVRGRGLKERHSLMTDAEAGPGCEKEKKRKD